MKQRLGFLFSLILMCGASTALAANNEDLAKSIDSFCVAHGGKTTYAKDSDVDPDTGRTCVTRLCTLHSEEGNSECNINLGDASGVPAGCVRAKIRTCGSVVSDDSRSRSDADQDQGGRGSGDRGGAGDRGVGDRGGAGGRGDDQRDVGITISNSGDMSVPGVSSRIRAGGFCYDECKSGQRQGFLWLQSCDQVECRRCQRCLKDRYGWSGSVNGRGGSAVITNSKPDLVLTGVDIDVGAGSRGGGGGGRITRGGGNGDDDNYVIYTHGGFDYRVPAYCLDHGNFLSKCKKFLTVEFRIGGSGGKVSGSGSRNCEYSVDDCVSDSDRRIIYSRSVVDCDGDCDVRSRSTRDSRHGGGFNWEGLAEFAGAIAPPLAQLGVAALYSGASVRSNKAWANAATAGFEQCRLDHQGYLDYTTTNELPGVTPEQMAGLGCNGFNLNGFAGLGAMYGNGLGGFGNSYLGAGYSQPFLNGMIGPYGLNGGGIYGMPGAMAGGIAGGINIGIAGGYNGGYNGGYMAGGINGGYLAGGINGGYLAGGYNGGYMAGGINGGYLAGGYNGGYLAGGAVGGLNIGLAGGIPGGYMAGGINGGYLAGGINGGYMAGGINGGYLAGGINGGYMNGGINGGINPWGNGAIPGYGQGSYYNAAALGQNYQAAGYDSQIQQRALASQFGIAGNNMASYAGGGFGGYGVGAAAYSPLNLGVSLNAGFGIGF